MEKCEQVVTDSDLSPGGVCYLFSNWRENSRCLREDP
jgi:hypothetical protein